MKGHIYILTNPSFPHLIKIGETSRSTDLRAKELSRRSTGVPTPFELKYSRRFCSQKKIEKIIHKNFQDYRETDDREFFRMDINEAIRFIDDLAIKQLSEEIELKEKRNTTLENKIRKQPKDWQQKIISEAKNWWKTLNDDWKMFFLNKIELGVDSYVDDDGNYITDNILFSDVYGNYFWREPNDVEFLKISLIDTVEAEHLPCPNLEPLKFFKNLTCYIGFYVEKDNLSLIKNNFPLLEKLDLYWDSSYDINDISSLKNLKELSIKYSFLKDLSPISKLTNLRYLELGHLGTSDLKPLVSLKKLRILSLNSGIIDWKHTVLDLTPIQKMEHLNILNCNDSAIKSLYPLHNHPSLECITLCDTEIEVTRVELFETEEELTTIEIKKLKKSNPNCKIITDRDELMAYKPN